MLGTTSGAGIPNNAEFTTGESTAVSRHTYQNSVSVTLHGTNERPTLSFGTVETNQGEMAGATQVLLRTMPRR